MSAAREICWLDGRFLPLTDARISPLDRGFLFGDSAYEVLPVYGGRVFRLESHLARFERSLQELRMSPPLSREQWCRVFGGLITRNGGGDLLLYLQVSRGAEADRSHVPRGTPTPTVFGFASRAPVPSPDVRRLGVACITAEDLRWGRCDIKSTALLGNVLLKWQALDGDGVEAILLRDGHLTEGSMSSVHVVIGGELLSPPLSPYVLPGITREVLHEIASRNGVPNRTRQVTARQLHEADELLIASSGGWLRPVTQLDGRPVGDGKPGPVFERLEAAMLAARDEFSTECAE